MTLQEAKDQVARKHLFKNWENFSISMSCSTNINQKMLNEVSDLYARSKWEEACEAQKQICSNSAHAIVFMGTGVVHKESILQANKPEFKP